MPSTKQTAVGALPSLPFDENAPEVIGVPMTPTTTNLPYLGRKVREELDEDKELISDDEILNIVKCVGTIPYRVVTRVLVLMEQRARKKGDVALIVKVRNLKMQFSTGVLELAKMRHGGRC